MTLLLKSVMTDLAAAAQTTLDSGRTAFSRPVEAAVPGDVVVGYPTEPIAISTTYRRGQDRVTVPLWRICGLPQDVATQDAMDTAIAGASNLIAAIETYAGTWDSVSVMSAQVDTFEPIGQPAQLALRLDIDILS